MTHRHRQQMLLAWASCASCIASLAVTNVEPGPGQEQPYRVTRWTTENGLPQNRIACLKQTRDGYLWIGTWFGLARFDGVRFTVFDKANTPELPNDSINALAEDTDGILWIATSDGLVSYRDHRFRRFTIADGLPEEKIWRLAASVSGGIWLQSGPWVARWERGKVARSLKIRETLDMDEIRSLKEDAQGWLDLVMGRQWVALSPQLDQWRTNFVREASESPVLAGWQSKASGARWIGTGQGLEQVEPTGSRRQGPKEFDRQAVDFLYEDQSGNLWAQAAQGRLRCHEQDHWRAIDLGERGRSAATLCMEEDREGNFWFGTEDGLVQLRSRKVRAFTTADGLGDDSIWSVCEDVNGVIWLGGDRTLDRIQSDRATPLPVADTYRRHANRCLWPRRSGGAWVAKSGVGIFACTDRFQWWVAPDSLPDLDFHALFEDRLGRLWIGTGNGVVATAEGQVLKILTNWNGSVAKDVRAIFEDRAGNFWFGTQGQGLTRLRNDKFEVFTTRDGLSSDRVWAIHEDSEGALWLGTENGLNRFVPPDTAADARRPTSATGMASSSAPTQPRLLTSATTAENGKRFFAFKREHGLLEDSVNWILEDDFGCLWLSGLRGIYRVKREQLNAVADGRARQVECAAFGTADGMESSETNGEGQPAGWKARDGRLWFPTTRGVVVIDPKHIEISEVPMPVVIEQVKADNEVIFGDGMARSNPKLDIRKSKLGLPPGRAQVLEIFYTANTFVDPKRTRFRYRLVGRDTAWREETSERVAHYTNLRPGNYQFEVTAANHHGVWKAQPVSFAFSLAPHFYETWPFYFACGAAVIGVAASVQAYRLRWQRRVLKLEEQRALANERTRIARDLHDDLGASLTGVALQLEAAQRRGQAEGAQLAALAGETRALAHDLRELAWTTNPRCDNTGSLVAFIGEQAERFCQAAGLECQLELPMTMNDQAVPARVRHELLVVVKESLANVSSHARARSVKLSMALSESEARVEIQDDGVGFDPARLNGGNGLRNLRERVQQLGGSFCVEGKPGQGVKITASLPLLHPEAS